MCNEGGELICCDTCPQSFHLACAGLEKVPEGDEWNCETCCRYGVDFVDDSELKEEERAFVETKFKALHDAYDSDASSPEKAKAANEPSNPFQQSQARNRNDGRVMSAFLSMIREEDDAFERQTKEIEEKSGFTYTANRNIYELEAQVLNRFTDIQRVQRTLQTLEDVPDVDEDDDEDDDDDFLDVATQEEEQAEDDDEAGSKKRKADRFMHFSNRSLRKNRPKYVYVLSLSRYFGEPVLGVENRNVVAASIAGLEGMHVGLHPALRVQDGHGRGRKP